MTEVTPETQEGWGEADELVRLVQVDRNHFRVLDAPVRYVDRAGTPHEAPDRDELGCWETDLASVPFVAWGLIAPYGRQTRSAILHDWGCLTVKKGTFAGGGRGAAALDARRAVDDLFQESLLADGVNRFRAWLMWCGVSIQRLTTHGRLWLAFLLVVQLAVSAVLVWFAAVPLLAALARWARTRTLPPTSGSVGVPPWAADPRFVLPFAPWVAGVVVLAVVLVAAAAWWRAAGSAVLGVVVFGSIAAPLALANIVVGLLLGTIGFVAGWKHGDRFDFGPTIIRVR